MVTKGILAFGTVCFLAFVIGCAGSEDNSCVSNQPCTCNSPGSTSIGVKVCVNANEWSCSCSGAQTGAGGQTPQTGAGGTRVATGGAKATGGKGGVKAAGGTKAEGAGGVKAGGAGGSTKTGGTAGKTSTNAISGTTPASLPKPTQTCPQLVTGNVTFLSDPAVSLTVGPAGKKGPMVFYWHGTAMTSAEAGQGLGAAALADVSANGGVIASFNTTSGRGTNTGDMVWYTGDFDTADEILACALEQGLVDITHIHSAGYSAGALQSGAMVFAKGYLASILGYSGGVLFPTALPDPSNVPSMIGAHGPSGTDTFIMNLGQSTIDLETTMKGLGGFVIDCQDTGDHVVGFMTGGRTNVGPAAWQFFKDHPFKNNKPYAKGLPAASGFPDYCKIVQ